MSVNLEAGGVCTRLNLPVCFGWDPLHPAQDCEFFCLLCHKCCGSCIDLALKHVVYTQF